MAEPQDSCDIWNKLGSIAQVTNSEIGVDGVIDGTLTFNAGKFDNGMFTNNVANRASFDYRTNSTAGALEIWFIAKENSGANTRWLYSIDSLAPGGGGVRRIIRMAWAPTLGFSITFFTGPVSVQLSYNIPYSIGDKRHLFICWDTAGIAGGANIERLYVDGILRDSSNVDAVPNWAGISPLFYLGIVYVATPAQPLFNTEDNFKGYSRASISQDFIDKVLANRNTEAWGVGVPANVQASDGIYQEKTTITWDSAASADTYEIHRSNSLSGTYATMGSGWQTSTNFDDSTGTLGLEYWYKVRGMDISSITGDFSSPDVGSRGYSLDQTIKLESKNKMHVFRRLYMKRRISGDYESTWQRVPQKYIMKFGKISFSVDDLKANFLKYSGLTFQVHNDTGYFSDINENKSFFYDADTRYKSLVKIEAGYLDTASTEWPSNTVMYVGILGEDITISEKNEMTFKTKHLSSIFNEIPASDIPGLGSTLTASDIITKIKNYTDGSNNLIFQKYISSGGWNITATTINYLLTTNSVLEGMNCWELMRKLAEAENKIIYVDRSGDFYFRDKTVLTDTSVYHFHGLGDTERIYGHNVKSRIAIDKGLRKVYNRIRVKFQEADTIASYYIKKESWAWGDSSSSYLHGVRTYDYNNEWIETSTVAQTIAEDIFNEYKDPKTEIKISSKFIPQLELNDRVNLKYQTRIVEDPNRLWGEAIWDNFVWGERSGYNVDISQDYRLIKLTHNIDKFESQETLREI